MAATEVGRLIVELEARVDKLERGMRRGTRSISNFERRSTRAFRRVGRIFSRLATRFAGITALIAAAAGVFSAVSFIRDSIEAAAAVDTFEIRLRNLIGSTEIAAQTLENLTERAKTVAPTLRDIIGAAATLGTVALGSASKIERLTDTALNIAAVTGLTLDQAAQNLQRTLSAGIGAADLFRERGVRALVESLTGIPNLIELPFSEVEAAFQEVFGPGGVFGSAADQFAQTLPGAISVTQDALFNLRAAFGEAISPALIAALKEIVIPFFEDLTERIKDNEDAIRDLATRGIRAGVLGFTAFARAVIQVIKLIKEGQRAVNAFNLVFIRAQRLSLQLRPEVLFAQLKGTQTPATILVEQLKQLEKFTQAKDLSLTREIQELNQELSGITDLLDEIDKLALKFGTSSAAAAEQAENAAEQALNKMRALLIASQRGLDPRILQQASAAAERLTNMLESAAIGAAKQRSEFEAATLALDREERKLIQNLEILNRVTEILEKRVELARRELDVAKTTEQRQEAAARLQAAQNGLADALNADLSVRQRTEARLAAIQRERVRLTREEQQTQTNVQGLLAALRTDIAALKQLDEERGTELQRQLATILAQNLAIEDQEQKLSELFNTVEKETDKVKEEIAKDIGADLSAAITGAVQTAFDSLRDPATDFATFLADISASLLQSALDNVLDQLQTALKDLFEDLNLSKGVEGAIVGAVGIGLALISNAFKDTEIETSAANVASAVTDVRQVRGVVAGPTQIGIAQVGETIETAFVETNQILRYGTDLLERILGAVGGSASGLAQETVGTSQATALGSTGPSLA